MPAHWKKLYKRLEEMHKAISPDRVFNDPTNQSKHENTCSPVARPPNDRNHPRGTGQTDAATDHSHETRGNRRAAIRSCDQNFRQNLPISSARVRKLGHSTLFDGRKAHERVALDTTPEQSLRNTARWYLEMKHNNDGRKR